MKVAEQRLNMDFTVTWRPFFLDATLPGGEGKDKLAHYKSKFGAERVAQMMPRMVQTFKDEGIEGYSIDGKVVASFVDKDKAHINALRSADGIGLRGYNGLASFSGLKYGSS